MDVQVEEESQPVFKYVKPETIDYAAVNQVCILWNFRVLVYLLGTCRNDRVYLVYEMNKTTKTMH